MADFQTEYPCVEVKCFRGQPRIYIRHQSDNLNKKKIVKSLTYEEWQALKDCMPMVDEQISKLSKPDCEDSITTQTTWCDNDNNNIKLNYSCTAQLSYSSRLFHYFNNNF